MTAPHFLTLSTVGKINYLQAVDHISERYEPDYTVLLYCIDGLFVEAFHHRRSGVIQIDCINNSERAKAYSLLPQTIAPASYSRPPLSYIHPGVAAAKPQHHWFKKLNTLLHQLKSTLVSNRSVTHP